MSRDLAIICSRFPYPLEKGDKLRIFQQIKILSKKFNIHLLALSHEKVKAESIKELKPFCHSIKIFKLSLVKSYMRVAFNLAFGNIPSQVCYFASPSIKKSISSYLIKIKPNHIYYQLSRTAYYSNLFPVSSSIDFMDAFHFGANKRAQDSAFLSRIFWKTESQRLLTYEQQIAKHFDYFFIISEQDKKRMNHIEKDIKVLHNGIDDIYLNSNLTLVPNYDIAFVGNLSYFPNRKAAEYLAKKIIPIYYKRYNQNLSCNIAGANSENLSDLSNQNIAITGWYDEIREAYLSAELFVAPLFHGMGQQNKILEAIALKKLCITTPEVAEALSLKHMQHVLIAKSTSEFVDQINLALNKKIDTISIIKNAYDKISKEYKWESTTQTLINIINKSDEKV